MNALKASIGELKYRHIFKLTFSCFYIKGNWSLAKSHLKQGGQIVRLIFYTKILATLLDCIYRCLLRL